MKKEKRYIHKRRILKQRGALMSYENEEICFSYGICMFFGLSELVLDLQCRMKNNFSGTYTT